MGFFEALATTKSSTLVCRLAASSGDLALPISQFLGKFGLADYDLAGIDLRDPGKPVHWHTLKDLKELLEEVPKKLA